MEYIIKIGLLNGDDFTTKLTNKEKFESEKEATSKAIYNKRIKHFSLSGKETIIVKKYITSVEFIEQD